MQFLFFAIFSCLCFTIVKGKHTAPSCITPNGERARCVTLCSCPILKEAYDSGNSSLEKFVEESACGNRKFTVCCGTSLNATKTPATIDSETDEETQRKLQRDNALNKLLPTRTYCGLQHYDDYFHDNETQVSVDEFPWLLDLESQAFAAPEGLIVVCSAVLISKKYALTISSCILSGDPKYIYNARVKIGAYVWRANYSCIETRYGEDCTDPIKHIYVEETIFLNNSELALLRLRETVYFTDYVRPICLPMEESTRPKINDTILTSGWGSSNSKNDDWLKNRITHRIGSVKECKARAIKPTPKGRKAECVLVMENVDNFCAVTQGGPTMYKYGNNWIADAIIKETDCNVGVHQVERITPEVVNSILDNMKP